jgi:folate-binding protein YgfZ
MANGRIAELSRRGVVSVGGADAVKFLNDLITSDVPTEGNAAYGGLLTPQGKVLFDFLIFRDGERFLFDLPKTSVADFVKRLTFYRLRARVEIADLSDERIVVAAWGAAKAPSLDGPVAVDPRLADLGYRAIVPAGSDMAPDLGEASVADYDAHRLQLGVPEGGVDFTYGDSFPHDADMDQLGGVDFKKGCYVGQEVVSRMEHRGTARRRFILAKGTGALPPVGTPVMAGDKTLGTLGSSINGEGLALVRLDRVKDAIESGAPISAGAATVILALPTWARFGWPATAAAED